jgi:plastocyanin
MKNADDARHTTHRRFTRRALLRAAAGTAGLAATGALAGCGDPGTARSDHDEITIAMTDEMRFDPDPVTVAAGTTIRFENESERFVHTATCDPALAHDASHVAMPGGAEVWTSGNVAPGASWSVTLDVPGEYRYVCLPHELAGMLGTITVEAR